MDYLEMIRAVPVSYTHLFADIGSCGVGLFCALIEQTHLRQSYIFKRYILKNKFFLKILLTFPSPSYIIVDVSLKRIKLNICAFSSVGRAVDLSLIHIYRKGSYPDKGKGIGKVAQQNFKQFKNPLGDEHTHPAFDLL